MKKVSGKMGGMKDRHDPISKGIPKRSDMKKAEMKDEKGKMVGGEKGNKKKMTPVRG